MTPELLPAIVSIEAFAYSDHKAGLVGRVFRALDAGGRWVFLDTTRRTNKTPPQAFASAWAEPQLATNAEIEELLKLAGFKTVRRVSVSSLVLSAAKQGYASLSHVVENAGGAGLTGREGALFLQELAWEAQSWRARMRALEGGAIEMNLWVADRTEQDGPLSIALDQVIKPDGIHHVIGEGFGMQGGLRNQRHDIEAIGFDQPQAGREGCKSRRRRRVMRKFARNK
jgi:hypothetical protein